MTMLLLLQKVTKSIAVLYQQSLPYAYIHTYIHIIHILYIGYPVIC
jgi:hypothetical protein